MDIYYQSLKTHKGGQNFDRTMCFKISDVLVICPMGPNTSKAILFWNFTLSPRNIELFFMTDRENLTFCLVKEYITKMSFDQLYVNQCPYCKGFH